MASWVCPRCKSMYDWAVVECHRCKRPGNGLRVLRPRHEPAAVPAIVDTPVELPHFIRRPFKAADNSEQEDV